MTEEVLQEWGPLQSLQMTHRCAAYDNDTSCVRFSVLMIVTISFIVCLDSSSCSLVAYFTLKIFCVRSTAGNRNLHTYMRLIFILL
jgi:hypothetical protein